MTEKDRIFLRFLGGIWLANSLLITILLTKLVFNLP